MVFKSVVVWPSWVLVLVLVQTNRFAQVGLVGWARMSSVGFHV